MLNVNELIGFGAGGEEPIRFWRAVATTAQESGSVCCLELELRETEGGSNVVGGGTPISSGDRADYPVTKAFDGLIPGNATEMWLASVYGAGTWLGYEFPVERKIRQVVWWRAYSLGDITYPTSVSIQYARSLSGPWTTAVTASTPATWPGSNPYYAIINVPEI